MDRTSLFRFKRPFTSGLKSCFTKGNMSRAPVICVPHGGGPLPILGDPGHAELVNSFQTRVRKLLKLGTPEQPRAIIVVTAHWSQNAPTISGAEHHKLYYDYGGFPREAYQIRYDAPGSPELAKEIEQELKQVGLAPLIDKKRGWDHGVFVPLIAIHPEADIPIIQLSVLNSEDPEQHFRMGEALSKLRSSNVAIIGSAMASLHNFEVFRRGPAGKDDFKKRHKAWNDALSESAMEKKLEDRKKKLEAWRDLPHSFEMHPAYGPEHFLPLIVCAGAGGDGVGGKYKVDLLGYECWTYYWADGAAV